MLRRNFLLNSRRALSLINPVAGGMISNIWHKTRIRGSISGVGPELITLELQLPSDGQGGSVEIEEGGTKRKVDRAGPSARLNVRVAPHTTTEFAVNRAA